jgi:hypothetical protein
VARPDTITFPSEGVKWHRDVGGVALAITDEIPVVAKASDDAHIVDDQSFQADLPGFKQVDHGE